MTPAAWRVVDRWIPLEEPLVMGILNVTPDSFSDGGELRDVDDALRRGEAMVQEGAGILDVGGESTRPGAAEVSLEEELRRVIPVVEALRRELRSPVSVDTRKAGVARRALEAGAVVVNDVSGLAFDSEMASVVARAGAGLVLMHMRGTPADMRSLARYDDPVDEVSRELLQAVERARAAGVSDDALVLDPGIGFAKNRSQSLYLLAELRRLVALGFPVMVGTSRKSFLGELLDRPPEERVLGSAVTCALAWERGARIFRVHDVEATVQALTVVRAVVGASSAGDPPAPDGVVHSGASSPLRTDEDNSR